MLGTYCLRAPRDVHGLFVDALNRAVGLIGMTPELQVHYAHDCMYSNASTPKPNPNFCKPNGKTHAHQNVWISRMLYTSAGRFDDALKTLVKGYKVDPLFRYYRP
jgi:hypothetical protein